MKKIKYINIFKAKKLTPFLTPFFGETLKTWQF